MRLGFRTLIFTVARYLHKSESLPRKTGSLIKLVAFL